jgi:dihydrofolate reductase
MIISAIVATGKNRVIGSNNEIPWYLPADLIYFKKTTIGHPIIMGRNTFHSIGRPLPKRTNIVITRDLFFSAEGILVAHNIEEALELAEDTGAPEAFIIGGGQVYNQSTDFWDKIYLTEVDIDAKGDTFFPEINDSEWREISREAHAPDEKNEHHYTFIVLERTGENIP